MKPLFTFFFRAFLCSAILLYQQSMSQAPVITTNIGIPGSGRGVTYGNGVYVCLVYPGLIYTSTDGIVWTRSYHTGISSTVYNALTFGNGKFVIVGQGGTIYSSSNGLTWTSQNSTTINSLYNIEYIGSTFYAVGQNSTLLTSTDGAAWTIVPMGMGPGTDLFRDISYGNGIFNIGASSSNSTQSYNYRSATGAANGWNYQNITTDGFSKMQYLKDRFYLFTAPGNIYTSTDASEWSNFTSSIILAMPDESTQSVGGTNHLFNGLYDGEKLYLIGSSIYYNGKNSIFSSTDGVHYSLQPKTATTNVGSVYVNNRYFTFGNEGITSSSDGINYKFPEGNFNGLALSGSTYIGVGTAGDNGIIYSSTDFNTWVDRTPLNQKPLNAVVSTGAKLIAAGDQTVIQSVDNGTTWAETNNGGYNFFSLSFGSNLLVAGTYDPSSYSGRGLVYSTDGINWVASQTDFNLFYKVKYINGNFLRSVPILIMQE